MSGEISWPSPQTPNPWARVLQLSPAVTPAQTVHIWSCVPPPHPVHIWSPKPASRLNTEHLGPKEPALRLMRPIWAPGCCSACLHSRMLAAHLDGWSTLATLPHPVPSWVWGWCCPGFPALRRESCTHSSFPMTQLMGLLLGAALGIA